MLHDPRQERPSDYAGGALWDAADYIERHGWRQGYSSEGESACVLYAIFWSHASMTDLDPPISRLIAYLGLVDRRALVRWNDAPSQTMERVVLSLRDAAHSKE